MRWPSRTGLTTTEVSGLLYSAGLIVSRDRLYKVADRLFARDDMRPNDTANRRFTAEQVTVLRAAFVLQDLLGVMPERIAELVADPDAVAEAMRHELDRRTRAVEVSLPGLAEALTCVSIRHASQSGSAGRHVA